MTRGHKINIILVTASILMTFFSCVIYLFDFYVIAKPLSYIGTVLIVLILCSNDMYRIFKWKFLQSFIRDLHFWGIISFLCIIPHTGQTGDVYETIMDHSATYPPGYIFIPTLAFIVLAIMTLTSIQGFQPKWWKPFHRIAWVMSPFIAYHLFTIDLYLLAIIYLIPIVLPFMGYFMDTQNRNVYIKQAIMLFVSFIFMMLGYYKTDLAIQIVGDFFLLAPIILAIYYIIKIKDPVIKKTVIKWFSVLIVALVLGIIFIA